MGEIEGIIQLYLKDSGLIEKKIKEIQLTLNEEAVKSLNTSMNGYKPKTMYYTRKDGTRVQRYRRTGHTMDSIQSSYEMSGLNGVVNAYLNQGAGDYGKYVEENSIWGGYHFLKKGLESTLNRYK